MFVLGGWLGSETFLLSFHGGDALLAEVYRFLPFKGEKVSKSSKLAEEEND